MLVDDVKAILARTGADPSRLQVEVTETSLMADTQANREVIKQLSSLGIKIAVDDFGTGYSSLAQLVRLKADTLKIDREFIQSVDHEQENRVIVAAMCRIAKSLQMKLVAEGVETSAQRNQMRLLGCDQTQGYFFYRPIPEADLITAVENSIKAHRRTMDEHFFLIYISRPVDLITDEQLQAIVQEASRFNLVNALTGFLFYIDKTFVQYLEGNEDTVRNLYARIAEDPRHADVAQVAEGTMPERLFTGWTMGFRSLDAPVIASSAHIESSPRTTYEWLKRNPSICCNLFETIASATL
jgi:hypothetical protein